MTIIALVEQDQQLIKCLQAAQTPDASPVFAPDQWQWHYLSDTQSLMSLMKSTPVDCVVSDMQVLHTDGAQLLCHIANAYPQTIRIAMSSQVDAEMTLESLHASHRFIAKPTEVQVLLEAIRRSLRLHDQLSDPRLRGLVTSITSLPVLPDIYNRLMSELASADFSIAAIGQIIESYMSLSVTLLKVVNSPYYGMVEHVESPTHAARLLGVELVKNILLYEKVLSQFNNSGAHEKIIQELNIAARIRGVLANRFARLARFSKRSIDHTQIAGMLSNLGELVIAAGMLDPMIDESSTFHPDQIGSSIMNLWSLPDPIVEASLMQRQATMPEGSLSTTHVIHALRLLEQRFAECDFKLGKEFTVETTMRGSSVDPVLQVKWFDCFCDYHLDLKQAA